jgi:hypothetical protein
MTTAPKTIAELEAASNAAHAAFVASGNAIGAMTDLVNALIKVEDAAIDGGLPEEVKSKIDGLGVFSIITDLKARIAAERIENDRLEDACLAAARALNDAPEEAA